MSRENTFEVIIIGGSYAGLSAGMALGRALRKVLILDSGKPCNIQTPHSHNFITQDGESPREIADKAKAQVLKYDTVTFRTGLALAGRKTEDGFVVATEAGEEFRAQKLIFATGVKDLMPDLPGFAECWGRSVIHCPYCHGYEVRHQRTGILADGDFAMHYVQLIRNWTKDLTVFTNCKTKLSTEQVAKASSHGVQVIEHEIAHLDHEQGKLKRIVFKDNSTFELNAIYSKPDFIQHCSIPQDLGCELNEMGLLVTDMFQRTNVAGITACGDNTTMLRSVANAVAMGNLAGVITNNMMTEAEFA
jgi:thioredoxin reductase